MKSLPPELIFVLVFVGIFLFQLLTKRRRMQRPQEPGQDPREAPTDDEMSPDTAELEQDSPLAWGSSRASVVPRERPEAPPAPRARPRRRFARQTLMGTRRDVQNAVVIATILGPCRALDPLSYGSVPGSPKVHASRS